MANNMEDKQSMKEIAELQKQLDEIAEWFKHNPSQFKQDDGTYKMNLESLEKEAEYNKIKDKMNKLLALTKEVRKTESNPKIKEYRKNLNNSTVQAKALNVALDTSIEILNGIQRRKHEYVLKSASDKKKYGKDPIYSVTQLTKNFTEYYKKENQGDTDATAYGTLLHRAIEELEKSNVFGKPHTGMTVKNKDVESFVKKLAQSARAEDQADAAGFLYSYGKNGHIYDRTDKAQQKIIASLEKNLNDYLRLKDSMGLGNKNATATEQALGARINVNGREVNIAGTLDQIFGAMITDLKSSGSVGADYGLQINLLRLLAQINGIKLDNKGKIIHLPRNNDQSAGLVDINDLGLKKILECIDISLQVQNAKTPEEKEKLYKKAVGILGRGGVGTTLGTRNWVTEDGKNVPVRTINGKSLTEWARHFAQNGGGAEALHDLIMSVPGYDRGYFQRQIRTRSFIGKDGKVPDDDKPIQEMFDVLKNKYTAYADPMKDRTISQGDYGIDIGARSFSGWMSMIAGQSPAKRQKLYDHMVGILEENLQIPQVWNRLNAEQYQMTLSAINGINNNLIEPDSWLNKTLLPREKQYWGDFYDFIKQGGSKEDWMKGGHPWHDLSDIDISKLSEQTKSKFIKSRMAGFSSINDIDKAIKASSDQSMLHLVNGVFKSYGINDKGIMEMMPADAAKILADEDAKFDPRRDSLLEDELLEEFNPDDKILDSTKVAHKLSYLYYAKDIYASAIGKLFKNYQKDHNDELTANPAEFVKANLTSEQSTQMAATMRLREEIDALLDAGYDWGYILWYLGGKATDSVWLETIAGEDGSVRNVLHSLAAYYKECEDSAQYAEVNSGGKDSLIDVIEKQIGEHAKLDTMTGSDGALENLVLQGSTITAMHTNKEAQDNFVAGLSDIDDRVSRYDKKKDRLAAKRLAKWRDTQIQDGLYYVYGDSDNKNYAAVRFLADDGDVVGRIYIYECGNNIGRHEYVRCPTAKGDAKGYTVAVFLHESEEKIREKFQYDGEIKKLKGPWVDDVPSSQSVNVPVGDPNEITVVGLNEEFEKRNEQISAESLLGDTTAAPVNADAPVVSSSASEPASPVKKRGRPKGSGKAAKPSTKEIQAVQETIKEVVEDKVEAALSSPEAATPSRMSAADKQEIIHKGIQHVEHMKITAENINIKHVENNVNNYPKGTGPFGGGGSGKKGKDKAAEAAELAPEEKLERVMSRVRKQFDENLKDQLKILDNEHQIEKLQKENTAESLEYAKSLKDQNDLLKSNIAGREAKIEKLKKTEGIDTADLERRYQIHLALQKNQYNYKNSQVPKGAAGAAGAGSKRSSAYYSLDGRIVWWFERMVNGGAIMKFFQILRKGLTEAIKIAKELDKSMTEIRIVTGTTRVAAQQLTGQFINLSKELGTTAQDVLGAARDFYRQGYQTADVMELVTSTTKLSKLGMIDMTKATQDLTSALKGFKMASNESIKVVDKLTAIDMQAAVTAGEIAEGLSQFANLANVNGVNLDQAAAYVATIAEVTQNSGSAVGSSLKMIMSRYGNVKAGAYNKLNVNAETMDNSQDLNDVEKVLKKLGISIRDANLHFKDFDVIIDELAERWSDLDNVTKRAISTSFAGTRQQEAFLTLMENYDKYKKNLEVSENSAGTADKKYKSYQESYEAAKASLDDAIKQLVNNAQINKTLTDVTKGLTWVVEHLLPWFVKWLPMILHAVEDVKALMGKSLVQKAGQGISDVIHNTHLLGTNVQGAANAANIAAVGGGAGAGGANAAGTTAAVAGGGSFSAILAGVSMIISSLSSALIAYKTSGATHKYEDSLVESSEAAQETAGAVSAILALIPFGIGSFFDNIIGIGEKIAGSIDKARDIANKAAKDAAKMLQKLDSINNNIENIGHAQFGSAEFNDGITELLSTLYETDNKDLRKTLDLYLGGPGSLYDTIEAIKKNDEKSLEAYKKLQLAQLEAKKAQIPNKYADQFQDLSETMGTQYSRFDHYNGKPSAGGVAADVGVALGGAAVGTGIAVGSMVGTGVALGAGSLAVAGGLSLLGPIGLLLGVGFGIFAAIKMGIAQAEEDEKRHALESEWNRKTTSEQMNAIQDRIKEWQADTENNHAEDIKNAEELLATLKEQNAMISQMMDERNDISLRQGLIDAKYQDQYIQDMSIAQLKNLGNEQILQAIGESAEDHGFDGYTLFDNGKLTDAGYDYLMRQVKNLGDDEISAVLSGQAYTLSEALKLRERLGNTKQVQKILESFAASLGTTVDQLEAVESKYGSLTLADTYLSTTELANEISKYTGLLDSITTGAGNVSAWMNEIINQFPDLIAYMSDVPTLFEKIGTKIRNLSNQYINAQYTAVSSDETTYSTIKEKFYERIGDSDITKLLDKENITSISAVTDWLKKEYLANGKLSDRGQKVLDSLKEVTDQFGLSITSSVLKGYYDHIINFKTQVLDQEINNLNEQKEALQDINKQREYENSLIEAKLKLENAIQEKKRVYRAGVGWVYESDQNAIIDAQKNISDLENRKTVSELETQIAELESQKADLSSIYEKQNFELLSKLYDDYIEEAQKDGDFYETAEDLYQGILKGVNGVEEKLSNLIQNNSDTDAAEKAKAVEEARKAWNVLTNSKPGSRSFNTALSNFHTAMQNAKNVGMTEEDTQTWGSSVTMGNGDKVGAWAASNGKESEQKYTPKMVFDLENPHDTSEYYKGTSNMELMTDSSIAAEILEDLKDPHDSYMWLKNGDGKGFYPSDSTIYQAVDSDDTLQDYVDRLYQKGVSEYVILGIGSDYYGDYAVYVKDGKVYKVNGDSGKNNNLSNGDKGKNWRPQFDEVYTPDYTDLADGKYTGDLSFAGGPVMVNELGTEAIITPQGTLTSLPSQTGIIPADITKNLWALGDVAPNLMRMLELHLSNPKFTGVGSSVDESFNINTINMTVEADGSFDAQEFVDSIKRQVALTRNLKR